MPGYSDAERAKSAPMRAAALVDSAKTNLKNNWFGRSWSEVGWSVLRRTGGGATWVAGQGLKVAINNVAGMFGPLAQWATGKELNQVAGDIGAAVVEQVWPLVEDQLKGGMEDATTSLVSARINPEISSQVSMALKQELEDKSPAEKAAKLQNTISELCVRAATLSKRLGSPSFTYCDDVYYAALEFHQIEALRAESLLLIDSMRNELEQLAPAVTQLDATGIKRAIDQAATAVTADNSTVSHNNHYRMNLVAAKNSCSLQHCYGKKP